MNECANCGAAIGELETAFGWKGKRVCATCYEKLNQALVSGATIPYATPAGRRRRLGPWWLLGGVALLFLFVIAWMGMRLGISKPPLIVPKPATPPNTAPAVSQPV